MRMSRRSLLAGVGAASGLVALPDLMAPGVAEADPPGPGLPGVPGPALGPSATVTLTPGLTYSIQDPTDWSGQALSTRVINFAGAQPAPGLGGGSLVLPVRMPVGAALKEVTVPYVNPAATPMVFDVFRFDAGGTYTQLATRQLASGTGVQSATVTFSNEPKTDGSQSYMALVNFFDSAQFVQAARIGYVAPPKAFVANTIVPRVLDTRLTGGKLNPSEERVVATGVPGSAAAAVLNLTVTETENAGYVAVFAANMAWPGNSSINWSGPGQNVANGVVTAVDTNGGVKIRGAVSPTHVVIDLQGYFL